MSQNCFCSKYKVGVQKTPPEKLLPQFDCTTCLEMLWNGSSNYFLGQTFSGWNIVPSQYSKIKHLDYSGTMKKALYFEGIKMG